MRKQIITNIVSVAVGATLATLVSATATPASQIQPVCVTPTPIVSNSVTPALPTATPAATPLGGSVGCVLLHDATYTPSVNLVVRRTPERLPNNLTGGYRWAGVPVPVYCLAIALNGDKWLAVNQQRTQWVAYEIKSLRSTPYGSCPMCELAKQ